MNFSCVHKNWLYIIAVKKYLVVIGDIVDSKKLNDRHKVQSELENIISCIDNRSLKIPYSIIQGDEIQALYSKPDGLFADIISVMSALYPVKIRFAIAAGIVVGDLDKGSTRGLDGSAFHNARKTMDILKQEGALFNLMHSQSTVRQMSNSSLAIISNAMETWKSNRFRILVNLMSGATVDQISKQLGISSSAIYKNISDGGLEHIIELFNACEKFLEEDLNV